MSEDDNIYTPLLVVEHSDERINACHFRNAKTSPNELSTPVSNSVKCKQT